MFSLFTLLLWAPVLATAGDKTTQIKVGTSETGEIATFAFKLHKDTTVHVKSAGLVVPSSMIDGQGTRYYYYGWIIDSSTRKPVWDSRSRSNKNKQWVFEYDGELTLKKGNYEIYYAAIRDTFNRAVVSKNKYKDRRGKRNNRGIFRKYKSKLNVTVTAPRGAMNGFATESLIKARLKKVPIALVRAGDDARMSADFELAKETRLRIYALGEAIVRDGDIHDYGWITNADSGEIVWFMGVRAASYAGGTNRNIQVRKQIVLPAGRYRAHYITDDSHAYGVWNSMPPDDPFFWGMTIRPVRAKDPLKVIDKIDDPKPVIAINKVTGSQNLVRGMELKKKLTLRLLCIGEFPKSLGEPVDYGWITNAHSGEIVWSMEKDRVRHAGGRHKNSMVDRHLTLPKGSYLVHYRSNGAHHYGRFVLGSPHDPERYGITLWPLHESDRDQIKAFEKDARKTPNVLVRIQKVGNHAYKEATFELARDARIRIFAMGEGNAKGMADYAWIEDDRTGHMVWEMKFSKTSHAGGDKMNRLFDGNIGLKRGRYKVLYETDGSHAYKQWNKRPPDNEERYGVTIYLSE